MSAKIPEAASWRQATLGRFDEIVTLSKQSRPQRFLRSPISTLYNSVRFRLIDSAFRLWGVQLTKRANTFLNEPLSIIVPPYGDILSYGAEVGCDAEVRLTRFFLRNLKDGMTFFDVGANIGYYSVLASRAVGPEGSVYSFEPSPPILKLLRANTEKLMNLHVVPCAVTDANGSVQLYVPPPEWAGIASLLPDWQDHGATAVSVEAIRLDDYCGTHKVRPDFLKIDVEGAEDRVLSGAKTLFLEHPLVFALEVVFNPIREVYAKALKIAKELGYVPYTIGPQGDLTPLPFEGFDRYFVELKDRYNKEQKGVNDFDNLIFQKPHGKRSE